MSEYMIESEAWAVARWEVGSCSMLTSKINRYMIIATSRCVSFNEG